MKPQPQKKPLRTRISIFKGKRRKKDKRPLATLRDVWLQDWREGK